LKAARSRAFDGYSLLEDGTDLEVQKLHTLDNSNNLTNNNVNINVNTKNKAAQVLLRVSCIAWSNAGSTIAVCYEQVLIK
jgi:hypothetical protein